MLNYLSDEKLRLCLQHQFAFASPLFLWNRKRLFASEQKTEIDCLFNIALALKEIEFYTPNAFAEWQAVAGNEENGCFESNLDLLPAQKAWLAYRTTAVPNWSALKENGTWSADVRASFVSTCLSQMGDLNAKDADLYSKAKKIFADNLVKMRSKLPANIFPQTICLVEGDTEAILLPHFAQLLSCDLAKSAVMIMPVGGSKQAVKKYMSLKDNAIAEIVVILDRDADVLAAEIKAALRGNDRLHVLSAGEIEDTFVKEIIIAYLNKYLESLSVALPIAASDLDAQYGLTKNLDRLWHKRGLRDFDKVDFATSIAENMQSVKEVPGEIAEIIRALTK